MSKQDENKEIQIRFGKNLQSVRKTKNISQEELADSIDTHRTYIGMIERGERNPTLTTIYKIKKALGITIAELWPK